MNNLKRTKIFSKRKKVYQQVFGIRARADVFAKTSKHE